MDKQLPTNTTNVFWIYADYPRYIFQKAEEERLPGKWLLFETKEDINQTWNKIKEATEKGLLGPYSKVSTMKEKGFDKNTFVICIFTEDFNNSEDVNRIENCIRDLGIQNKLSYKLNRDAGKYEKDGHSDLVQRISE